MKKRGFGSVFWEWKRDLEKRMVEKSEKRRERVRVRAEKKVEEDEDFDGWM